MPQAPIPLLAAHWYKQPLISFGFWLFAFHNEIKKLSPTSLLRPTLQNCCRIRFNNSIYPLALTERSVSATVTAVMIVGHLHYLKSPYLQLFCYWEIHIKNNDHLTLINKQWNIKPSKNGNIFKRRPLGWPLAHQPFFYRIIWGHPHMLQRHIFTVTLSWCWINLILKIRLCVIAPFANMFYKQVGIVFFLRTSQRHLLILISNVSEWSGKWVSVNLRAAKLISFTLSFRKTATTLFTDKKHYNQQGLGGGGKGFPFVWRPVCHSI